MVGQFVLADADIRKALKSRNIVTLKADVTRPNQEAYDLLKSLNHEAGTVPYFALFAADDPDNPRTHSALFTKDDMRKFIGS
jgi:thiol:disulfide interchange protein